MRRRGLTAAERVARVGAALVACVGGALGAGFAAAGPSGAKVRGGTAAISTDGATTTVVQSTPRALIEWDSFDIDAGETVRFAQPGRDSVALNRVTGPSATDIRGRLQANGNVWIVNRHGVTIHQGARIDVGGLLATTADIADDAFMRGDDRFDRPGAPGASVVNAGEISFGDAGLVGLVAPDAANHGVISGRLGEVVIGGARTLAVDFAGDGLIAFPLDAGGAEALRASNAGTILNDGGRIRVSAAQAAALVDGAAALDGLARADTLGAVAGVLEVSAPGGAVSVTGRALARGGAGEAGGSAAVTGARVVVAEGAVVDVSGGSRGGRADIVGTDSLGFFGLARARGSAGPGGFVDTSAANLTVAGPVEVGAGGLWLIDPTNIVIGPTVGTDGVNVAAGNIVSALAAGGDVTVSTAGPGSVNGVDVTPDGADPDQTGTLRVIGGLTGIAMSAAPARLTLLADGDITLQSGISQTAAGGALSLRLIGDDGVAVQSGAPIDIRGAFNMTAGGPATFSPQISAGSINLTSVSNMSVLGGMEAAGDLLLRSSAAALTISAAAIEADGDLELRAAGSISVSSALTAVAGGDLTLNTPGNISISGGAITVGGAAAMTAGGGATISATLEAGSIAIEASGAMTASGDMDAAGNLSLRSTGGDLTVSFAEIAAQGALVLRAADELTVSVESSVLAQGSLDMRAGGSLDVRPDLLSAGGPAFFEAPNIQQLDDRFFIAATELALADVTLRRSGEGGLTLVNLIPHVDSSTLNVSTFNAAGPVFLALETESGAITAEGLYARGGGGVGPMTLAFRPTGAMRFIGSPSNFGTVTVGSGTPATTATTALSFEGEVFATSFAAVARGDVTQTAAVTLGTLDVRTAGDLALDLAANDFATVTGAAARAALRDGNGFLVDGLEAGATDLTAETGDLTLRAMTVGDLTAVAGGRLRFEGVTATSLSASAQSIVDPRGAGDAARGDAALSVSGDASLAAVGDVSLANATGAGLGVHVFGGRVDIAAEQASLRARSAVRLGAVEVSSAVDLDPTIADGVALRVRAAGIEDTAGARVNAVGPVALTSTADGADPAGSGAALTNGADIVLDNAGADALAATSLTLQGEDIFVRLADDVALGAVSAADTANDARFDADAAGFSAFERSFNLTVHAGRITDTAGLRVEAGGDARFVAAVGGGDVADSSPATLTNGRDIVLDNAGADDALRVGGLSLAGEDALIQSDRAVMLRRVTLADTDNDALSGLDASDGTGPSLILRAGTITDAAEATQTGAGAEFRASAGGAAPTAANGRDIALDNGLHQFGGAVSLSGEDVFLSSAGALALGDVTARASVNDATLNAVRAAGPGGDRVLTLRAGGAVTQSSGAALVADGLADVAAIAGATPFDVTLANAGNDVRAFSALGAAVALADGSTGGDALAPDLTVTDTRAATSLTVVSAGALALTRAQVEGADGARGALTADAATTLAARDLSAGALTLRTGAGAADPAEASALTLEGFTADTLTVRVAETGAGRGRALTLARGALAGAVDLSDPLRPLTALTVTETTLSGAGTASLAVSSGQDANGVADRLAVDRVRHAGGLSLAGRAVEIGRLSAPALAVAARASGGGAPAEVVRLSDAGLAAGPGETEIAGVALAAPGAPTDFRTARVADMLSSDPFPDLVVVAGETRIVSDGAILLRGGVDGAGDPLRNAFGGAVHLSAAGDVGLETGGALVLGDVSAARLALRANAADAAGGAAGISQAAGSAVAATDAAAFVTGSQAAGFDRATTGDIALTEAGNAFGGPVSLIARDAALAGAGGLMLSDARLAGDLALDASSGDLTLRDVAADGDLSLRAAGALDLARVSAARLDARAGGAARARDVATTGRAVVAAGGALTARDLALGGATLSGTVATVERARIGGAGLTLRATVGALSADAVSTPGALTLDAATDARLGALKAATLGVGAGWDALGVVGAAAATGIGALGAAAAPATDPALDAGDPADARALLALGPLAAAGGSAVIAPGFDRLIETAGAAAFAVGRDLAATREPGGAARHNAFGGPVSLTGGGPDGLLAVESAGALTLGPSALNGAALLARAGSDGAQGAAIGQSGAIDMGATPGAATLLVGDPAAPGGFISPGALTGSVTLERGANRFGRVSVAAGSARLASDRGYEVAGARLAGDLEARSGGALAVRDAGVGRAALLEGGLGATVERLTVGGALTVRGAGPVALTDVSASSATVRSAGGVRLGSVAVRGAVDIRETAGGDATLAGLRTGGALTLAIEGPGAVAGAAPEAGPAARGAAAATLGAEAANGRVVAFRFDAAADAAGARLGSVRAQGPSRARLAAPGGVSLAGVGAGARPDGAGGFVGPDANRFAGGLTLVGVGGTAALEHAGDLAISVIDPAPGLDLTLIPEGDLRLEGVTGSPDARLGTVAIIGADSALLDADTERDVLFARVLVARDIPGALSNGLSFEQVTELDLAQAFFGVNLSTGFSFSNVGEIALTGSIRGNNTRAAGLFPEGGPTGAARTFNNCLIGDLASCGSTPAALNFTLSTRTPALLFDLTLTDLADVYTSFGNEELWAAPAAFATDLSEEDAVAEDEEGGP